MKFKINLSVILISLFIVSCSKGFTEYNGHIKNSSENTIHFEIVGDTLVLDSITIPPGTTQKIYHFKEEGDFEIYDCRSFFDTIYFSVDGEPFSLLNDSASITTTSSVESDEIRVHDCIIDIK
tara:strand:- start:387 stop:755 length:369 start_codon:yes stop_codon:yes gene_type:complete